MVLEFPAYFDLWALHGLLLAHLPFDPELAKAMRLLFFSAHFRPLPRFLRASDTRWLMSCCLIPNFPALSRGTVMPASMSIQSPPSLDF